MTTHMNRGSIGFSLPLSHNAVEKMRPLGQWAVRKGLDVFVEFDARTRSADVYFDGLYVRCYFRHALLPTEFKLTSKYEVSVNVAVELMEAIIPKLKTAEAMVRLAGDKAAGEMAI